MTTTHTYTRYGVSAPRVRTILDGVPGRWANSPLALITDVCTNAGEGRRAARSRIGAPFVREGNRIVVPDGADVSGLTIFDLTGRIVLGRARGTAGSPVVDLGCEGVAPGTYNLAVRGPGRTPTMHRIVVR